MKPSLRQALRGAVLLVPLGLASLAACLNGSNGGQSQCASPSSGRFSFALGYSQTLPVGIYCDGATDNVPPCGSQPHPFDGVTWTVSVDGSGATVTAGDGGAPWSCDAITPESAPGDAPDGGSTPGTGCYLLVTCTQENEGDAGAIGVQLQMFAQASSDVLVVVHDLEGNCCTDEYTGTWQ
jgi:hypothetical protein